LSPCGKHRKESPEVHLNLLLLSIVLLLAIGALAYFMRKPSNRNAGDRMPERGEPGAPNKPRGEPLNAAEVRRSEQTAKR